MKLIKNPLGKNHYEYVNELLEISDNKHRAESLKENQKRTQLIQELNIKLKELEAELLKAGNTEEQNRLIEANLLKLKRVQEMLHDDSKKIQYDAAIATPALTKLQVAGKEMNQTAILPLVAIEDIIQEFEEFSNRKDADGKLLIPQGCKYEKQEGPPVTHVFTFPDEKSKNDFLQILFSKNMAMLPNGSQSLEDLTNSQKSMKDQLDLMRKPKQPDAGEQKEPPKPDPTSTPTPFKSG